MNYWVWLAIAATWFALLAIVLRFNHRVSQLNNAWDEHKQVRENLYKTLSDPEKIELEMERSARAREMRDAQRTTLPRHSGPPARVWRPKMRGAKPGNWRLQRP